ncbi:unnamed protein product [Clonostachys rosea f. rosea IK726]|uniref:Bromo domain-containing protein n=2 Tax=Bionectria ochroleuca TaxID=29856 RepID=A0A0B7JPG7_BIOOC|nr:unnamed protein product [Clonostachys rosea f. rosea IK726]
MASPKPESNSTSPPKQVDDAATKESKAEVNGHADKSESKSEAETKPEKQLSNGTGSGEENGTPNGADKDVEMKNGDGSKDAPSTTEKSETSDKKEAETNTTPKESSKDDDVEMKESEPAKEASAAPSDEKNDDDANESTTKPTEAGTEDPDKAKDAQSSPGDAGESGIDLQPASLSQLAIDGPEPNTSPVEPSVEVSMTDAPASKVPREREDDGGEEPAPKRAKTEPKEEEPTASTPTADGQEISVMTEFPKPKFDEFTEWYDAKNSAKEITNHRRREMRRTVARVKKTKHGGEFRDSVQKLWPALWEKYSLKIEKPMDLSEIDRNLRDTKYKTYGDFKADLALLVENSQAYNGPDHYITMAARGASKTVWDDVVFLPEEEPSKPKAPPKANRMRELRVGSNVKPEAPSGGSTPTPTTGPPAKAAQSVGEARRSSSVHDGDRPKRTVRAPKPKDIDYSSKPARKKLRPELQFCDEVLAELTSQKHWSLNQWFLDAVDAEGLGIPHYYSVIKHPMDLGKVSRMLANGEISSLKEFHKNVTLMFDNCYQFNGPYEQGGVSALAKQLQDIYTAQMKNKDTWLAKHAKANPPPASVSNPSDDDDDEDEEDGEDANAVADHTRAVKELEARLREEMDKQANLFAAEQPNQSMITIQQGIVSMVQEALLKAKTTLNEVRQKNPAGKPKKSKPAKAKAAGGGAGRKASGAAAQPKKAGAGPAKNKKKNLTAADKDHIAGAINDLEYPHLDRAIDIIKRDTGQMESEDGELELDIDQLSNDALLKLWELCKKALPGFAKDAAAQSPEVHRAAPSKSAPKTAAKPKKNKPMSALEQEARIAQLRQIRDMYGKGDNGGAADPARAESQGPMSSDDSSEEE